MISYWVQAAHFSSTGRAHAIDPFDSNPVAVDRIGRCTCNGHIVLWSRIVSIHGLQDCTLLSGDDPFYPSMTPLRSAVAIWHIRASQSVLDPPFVQETLQLSPAKAVKMDSVICLPYRHSSSLSMCCILTLGPSKYAITKWCTGRKWHIPMASNRKRSRRRV